MPPSASLDASWEFLHADRFAGAWVIHVVIITLSKLMLDALPGMTNDLSWTLICVGYAVVRIATPNASPE